MKNVSSIMSSFACTAILLSSALSAQAADKPLAKVNGKPISQQMLDVYAEVRAHGGAPSAGTAEEKKAVLEEVINLEIFSQLAEKEGIAKKPEVVAQLKLQRNRVLANMVVGEFLKKRPVTEEMIKAEYDKGVKTISGKEYKAKHILVKTEQEAKDIIKELDAGKKFEDLAKAKSLDSAEKGGDLGWFPAAQMVPEFAAALPGIEKGKYTKAPVKSQFGYHLIMVDDSRNATPPPFDQVKPQIQQKLARDLIEGYVGELRAKAKIEQ